MLGRRISDPDGIEGPPRSVEGLGYLDIATVLKGDKQLRKVKGEGLGAAFEGYEMHIGVSQGEGMHRPFLRYEDGHPEGAVSGNGLVAGCYVHGLFGSDAFRAAWIATFRFARTAAATINTPLVYEALIEETLDKLAAHLARHVDLDLLLKLAR